MTEQAPHVATVEMDELQRWLLTFAMHVSMVWTVLFNRVLARSYACLFRFCCKESETLVGHVEARQSHFSVIQWYTKPFGNQKRLSKLRGYLSLNTSRLYVAHQHSFLPSVTWAHDVMKHLQSCISTGFIGCWVSISHPWPLGFLPCVQG